MIAPPTSQQLFGISVGLHLGIKDRVYLVTQYYQGQHCVGELNRTACLLDSATGEYDVTIKGGVVTLEDAGNPRILAIANNTATNHTSSPELTSHPSTLGSVVLHAYTHWDTVTSTYIGPDGRPEMGAGGAYLEGFEKPSAIGKNYSMCPSYVDPREEVLESLNTMMFVAGAVTASPGSSSDLKVEEQTVDPPLMDPGLPMHYTVTGTVLGDHPVYSTDLRFFAAAALVELVCIAAIMPTFWGWWRIGRPVSFSPLEVARWVMLLV